MRISDWSSDVCFSDLARFLAAARLDALLLDEFVGRQIGEIVECLDPRLAERDEHRLGQIRHVDERILDAERLALLARGGLTAVERFGRAALKLGGECFVANIAAGDPVGLSIGALNYRAEAPRQEERGPGH